MIPVNSTANAVEIMMYLRKNMPEKITIEIDFTDAEHILMFLEGVQLSDCKNTVVHDALIELYSIINSKLIEEKANA